MKRRRSAQVRDSTRYTRLYLLPDELRVLTDTVGFLVNSDTDDQDPDDLDHLMRVFLKLRKLEKKTQKPTRGEP